MEALRYGPGEVIELDLEDLDDRKVLISGHMMTLNPIGRLMVLEKSS